MHGEGDGEVKGVKGSFVDDDQMVSKCGVSSSVPAHPARFVLANDQGLSELLTHFCKENLLRST